MLKLDNSLLDELGLGGLPDAQKREMLQHIYDTLELRVGTNLANQMTDQQLEEFEKFIDDGGETNQAQALQWLEANLPNYKQVVNEVFEQLKVEIKQMAPQLLATTQGAMAQTQPDQSAAQPGGYYQPPVPAGAYNVAGQATQPMQSHWGSSQPTFGQQSIPPQYPGGYQPSLTPEGQQPYGLVDPGTQQLSPQNSTDDSQIAQQPSQQNGQLPPQQPPAGPGTYPSQHPTR